MTSAGSAPALAEIGRSRVVAVLRASRPARLAEVAEVLASAGVTCIEFALSSEGTLEALRDFAAAAPAEIVVGAGTVLDCRMAEQAVAAGARYLLSPSVDLDVIRRGHDLGVPVIPGAFTPTEILRAWRGGAAAVKVFPAAQAGGPAYVAAVRAPLPDIPLVPTGGVSIGDVPAYLRAGAFAVGMGSPLLGDAADGGDLQALADRAKDLIRRVKEAST